MLIGRAAQNYRQTGTHSRNQKRHRSRIGAVKNQHREGTHSKTTESGTTSTQSASKTINRCRLRPAVSDQAPAAGSSIILSQAAQAPAEDGGSMKDDRAVEDDQERDAAGTSEEANEEELEEEQVDGTTHRQDKGGNEGPAEDGW